MAVARVQELLPLRRVRARHGGKPVRVPRGAVAQARERRTRVPRVAAGARAVAVAADRDRDVVPARRRRRHRADLRRPVAAVLLRAHHRAVDRDRRGVEEVHREVVGHALLHPHLAAVRPHAVVVVHRVGRPVVGVRPVARGLGLVGRHRAVGEARGVARGVPPRRLGRCLAHVQAPLLAVALVVALEQAALVVALAPGERRDGLRPERAGHGRLAGEAVDDRDLVVVGRVLRKAGDGRRDGPGPGEARDGDGAVRARRGRAVADGAGRVRGVAAERRHVDGDRRARVGRRRGRHPEHGVVRRERLEGGRRDAGLVRVVLHGDADVVGRLGLEPFEERGELRARGGRAGDGRRLAVGRRGAVFERDGRALRRLAERRDRDRRGGGALQDVRHGDRDHGVADGGGVHRERRGRSGLAGVVHGANAQVVGRLGGEPGRGRGSGLRDRRDARGDRRRGRGAGREGRRGRNVVVERRRDGALAEGGEIVGERRRVLRHGAERRGDDGIADGLRLAGGVGARPGLAGGRRDDAQAEVVGRLARQVRERVGAALRELRGCHRRDLDGGAVGGRGAVVEVDVGRRVAEAEVRDGPRDGDRRERRGADRNGPDGRAVVERGELGRAGVDGLRALHALRADVVERVGREAGDRHLGEPVGARRGDVRGGLRGGEARVRGVLEADRGGLRAVAEARDARRGLDGRESRFALPDRDIEDVAGDGLADDGPALVGAGGVRHARDDVPAGEVVGGAEVVPLEREVVVLARDGPDVEGLRPADGVRAGVRMAGVERDRAAVLHAVGADRAGKGRAGDHEVVVELDEGRHRVGGEDAQEGGVAGIAQRGPVGLVGGVHGRAAVGVPADAHPGEADLARDEALAAGPVVDPDADRVPAVGGVGLGRLQNALVVARLVRGRLAGEPLAVELDRHAVVHAVEEVVGRSALEEHLALVVEGGVVRPRPGGAGEVVHAGRAVVRHERTGGALDVVGREVGRRRRGDREVRVGAGGAPVADLEEAGRDEARGGGLEALRRAGDRPAPVVRDGDADVVGRRRGEARELDRRRAGRGDVRGETLELAEVGPEAHVGARDAARGAGAEGRDGKGDDAAGAGRPGCDGEREVGGRRVEGRELGRVARADEPAVVHAADADVVGRAGREPGERHGAGGGARGVGLRGHGLARLERLGRRIVHVDRRLRGAGAEGREGPADGDGGGRGVAHGAERDGRGGHGLGAERQDLRGRRGAAGELRAVVVGRAEGEAGQREGLRRRPCHGGGERRRAGEGRVRPVLDGQGRGRPAPEGEDARLQRGDRVPDVERRGRERRGGTGLDLDRAAVDGGADDARVAEVVERRGARPRRGGAVVLGGGVRGREDRGRVGAEDIVDAVQEFPCR